MTYQVKSPRKLIEVSLPLDAINAACAYEKMPGIGAHPRGIHLWWARRPLAAARAILFAQLVNDPGTNIGRGFRYGTNKKDAAVERARLFGILEDLVKWENSTNEAVLGQAREEIRRSWREVCELNKDHPRASELFRPDRLPPFHDPFAGGGAIPLEAQRLGLESYATDLNPVAVLINKAMIEIPPKFCGRMPVGPATVAKKGEQLALGRSWPGASGLAEDVRRFGAWLCDEAQKRIGRLYASVRITNEMSVGRPDLEPLIGQERGVLAWIWARTVSSPSPAHTHAQVPLVSSFILASKEGRPAYLEPIIGGACIRFAVRIGKPPKEAGLGTKANGKGANFRCLLSDAPISAEYIREEAKHGRIGYQLMAVVAKGARGRIYLPATASDEVLARSAAPSWKPEIPFFQQALGFRVGNYGMSEWADLFTARQLVGLSTLTDLVPLVHERVRIAAIEAGAAPDEPGLDAGGTGAKAYADAVSMYLAFAVSRCADFGNALCRWSPSNEKVMNLFGKQTLSMTWDFAEANFLADTVGGYRPAVEYIADCIEKLSPSIAGHASQADAQTQTMTSGKVVSTDPPYYDNIGYADLSDFFYVWLRRSLRDVFPMTLATIAVPKEEELVATPIRHGDKDAADRFFLKGMTQVVRNLADQAHPEGPVTIYYAFKQSDTSEESGTTSAGWEAFLTAVLRAGFAIVGTWPLRSEQEFRLRGMGANALASSIVLVCRRRETEGRTVVSRREFLRELNSELPTALDEMTRGGREGHSPVAPVDLSQAVIGPGMAVFSKYDAVLEADGSPMDVQTALQLINRFLAEDDFDSETQFCLHWFELHGWNDGAFGEADVLARSKATSVDAIREAGVVQSGSGRVRLLKWFEYRQDWDPSVDMRVPVWEALHQLIRSLRQGGESASGALLVRLAGKAEATRQLAYRLYTLCERLNQAEDARAYNELITSWTGIETAAANTPTPTNPQGSLFER